MMSKHSWSARLAAGLLACAPIVATAIEPAELVEKFPRGSLVLEAASLRCLHIHSLFADAPAQQRQGLMFVERMDEFEGMLFRYPQAMQINMWMKNTLIPLDMLFIDADGTIINIAANTTPLSTRRVSSARDVTQVLELNAGFARRWQLKPGNRLLLAE